MFLYCWLVPARTGWPELETASPGLRGHLRRPPKEAAFNASRLQGLDHLVLVAGHAILAAEGLEGVANRDNLWHLESYQLHQDLPGAFVGHIQRGVEMAAPDPHALLVFTGGQTRPTAGPQTEGSSYHRVAEHYRWWGHDRASDEEIIPIQHRAVTEDFATDSFQNLLFSLCRFKEVVGSYPTRVTVVGFDFKKRRFQDFHRLALRIPRLRFRYVGLQPPSRSHFDLRRAELGEQANAQLFKNDPFGCFTPELVAKRDARNPFRRTAPYPLSCPEIRGLLSWCGPGRFPERLPWEQQF